MLQWLLKCSSWLNAVVFCDFCECFRATSVWRQFVAWFFAQHLSPLTDVLRTHWHFGLVSVMIDVLNLNSKINWNMGHKTAFCQIHCENLPDPLTWTQTYLQSQLSLFLYISALVQTISMINELSSPNSAQCFTIAHIEMYDCLKMTAGTGLLASLINSLWDANWPKHKPKPPSCYTPSHMPMAFKVNISYNKSFHIVITL